MFVGKCSFTLQTDVYLVYYYKLSARSSVDRAPASGAGCVGSIPIGRMKAQDKLCFFYVRFAKAK